MSEAPEKIWAWHVRTQDGRWIGKHAVQDVRPNSPTATEYVRADHAQALVAAEQKEAYEMALDFCQFNALLDALENRTPDDAKAALEKVKREAREEALREALKIIHDEGWLGDTHNRITALIEKDKTDE